MTPQEYIDSVADKVTDENLRSRLKEELAEHWQDYSEHQSASELPQRVLGDGMLVARQTNAVMLRGVRDWDVLASLGCGLLTVAVFLLLRIFQNPYNSPDFPWSFPINLIGIVVWFGIVWYVYLALQRHLLICYGRSVFRLLLLMLAFVMPCMFTAMTGEKYASISTLLALSGAFFLAGRLASGRFVNVDLLLARLHIISPWIVAVSTATGIMIYTGQLFDSLSGPTSVLAFALAWPLLALYICLGMATTALGTLFSAIGIAPVFVFWLVVATFLVFVFVVLLALFKGIQKPYSPAFRFVAAMCMPFAVILPFMPRHVPQAQWKVPLVWTWTDLEKKQLNVTYPWAEAWMRVHNAAGPHIGYVAYPFGHGIGIIQSDGPTLLVKREGVSKIASSSVRQHPLEFIDGLSADMAARFTCDGHALMTPGVHIVGYEHVCHSLAFQGVEIAFIPQGSLQNLDLSEDGLLAVSLTRGHDDPTFVSVIDIAPLLAQAGASDEPK